MEEVHVVPKWKYPPNQNSPGVPCLLKFYRNSADIRDHCSRIPSINLSPALRAGTIDFCRTIRSTDHLQWLRNASYQLWQNNSDKNQCSSYSVRLPLCYSLPWKY